MCSSQTGSAASRLAKARLRWRRAADELLIGAIFDELSVVRRDGDCFGRRTRQAALAPALAPALVPSLAPAMVPVLAQTRQTGARQAPAPVY